MIILRYVHDRYGRNAMLVVRKLLNASSSLNRQNMHLGLSLLFKRNGIIPKSLHVKPLVRTLKGERTALKASKMFLTDRIADAHARIRLLKYRVHTTALDLAKTIQPADMFVVLNALRENVEKEKKEVEKRHRKKFKALFDNVNKEKTDEVNCQRAEKNIVNLSGHVLTSNQRDLLTLGLSFSFGGERDPPRLLAQLESALYLLPPEKRRDIRAKIVVEWTRGRQKVNNGIETSMKRALKELQNNNKITIIKSDKGNKIVIMDTNEYKKKALEHLNNADTYIKEKKDPTAGHQRRVNKIVSKLAQEGKLTDNQGKSLKSINPCLPFFYGLPKVHKVGVPLRPVISSQKSPVYNLSRFISKYLKPLVETSKYIIFNTQEFLKEIRSITLDHNMIMVSFDVCALYTSIPLDLVYEVLTTFLTTDNLETLNNCAGVKFDRDDVANLVKVCLDTTCFSFDEFIYKQKRGVAMGLPASSTIADLVMCSIEQQIIQKSGRDIILWRRYVDDVFAIVNKEAVSSILKVCNSINDAIQFTLEIEQNNELPFLDILLKRHSNNISTTVYRKPVAGNFYLHFSSVGPMRHKLSTIDTLAYRMLRYCSSYQDRLAEERKITRDLLENGYPKKLIKKRLSMVKKKFFNNNKNNNCQNNNDSQNKVILLPFIAGVSEKIERIFRKEGYRVGYRTNGRLAQLLRHRKKTPPDEKRDVIYNIPCLGCSGSYVGQSGRSFATRKKEHLASLKYDKVRSKFSEHMAMNGHAPDWNGAGVIYSGIRPLSARLFLEGYSSSVLHPQHFNEAMAVPEVYDVIFQGIKTNANQRTMH